MLRATLHIVFAVALGAALAVAGCSSNDSQTKDSAPLIRTDGSPQVKPDGQVKPGDLKINPDGQPECYQDPQSHNEIINGCTTAQSVDKVPFFPAKAPNGTLPPLP